MKKSAEEEQQESKSKLHAGHRARMTDRLFHPDDYLQDHELLEILLFYSIPRKNTNEIAHSLINSCGSLEGVFHTDPNILKSVDGIGPQSAAFIRVIGAIMDRIQAAGQKGRIATPFSFTQFSDHVQEKLADLPYEILEIYSVDEKNRITFSMSYTSNESNHVDVGPMEITKFIAENRPSAIAIAHNHPNTTCMPSQMDHDFTKMVYMICGLNKVKLLDHVIVGDDAVYSYRVSKLLDVIAKKCNVDTLVYSPLPFEAW